MRSPNKPATLPAGPSVKRLCAVFAVAILGAAAPCAHSASIVITAERHSDTIDIHANTQLQSDTETAWRVLTAYDRYTDFIPDLRTSRIVARQGATATVEQSGDARVWRVPVPLDITFEIVESPPTGLHSRAISGSLRAMESSYKLTPDEHGVSLDYIGHVAPGFEFFGSIELDVVKQNVARQFQALADEIERQSAELAAEDHAR
jgi:hypothetical protein